MQKRKTITGQYYTDSFRCSDEEKTTTFDQGESTVTPL